MAHRFRILVLLLMAVLLSSISLARSSSSTTKSPRREGGVTESPRAQKHMSRLRHSRALSKRYARSRRRHHYYERFSTSSFATDIADGDITAGEDPIVRQAALEALGNMNGTVVAMDPTSGRILAMVNQKLALSEGAQPCSTIKLSVALAALNEKLISHETQVTLGRRAHMDLTEALAKSNNAYFEALGRRLGFAKVSYYAHQFGLGELAGFNIEGEHLGVYPSQELDSKLGGVGKMCSFGESISMTPLQLGAMVSAIAMIPSRSAVRSPGRPHMKYSFTFRQPRRNASAQPS